MAKLTNLEKRLEELQKKKRGIVNEEQRLKSQLTAEKRKQENHCKMVLGGAVYGYLKDKLPSDNKDLELYGWALKHIIENIGVASFVSAVENEYLELKAKKENEAEEWTRLYQNF